MKTTHCTALAAALLLAGSALAQVDSITRIGGNLTGGGGTGARDRLPLRTRPDAPKQPATIRDLDWPFRSVNGQVYDANKAAGWVTVSGRVIQRWEDGRYLVGVGIPGSDSSCIVSDVPLSLVDGNSLPPMRAMRTADVSYTTTQGALRTVRGWTYGKRVPNPAPPQPAVQVISSEGDAKLLAWQQERAARGEASGQYELGLRYLAGRGVTNSPALAREWFTKATAQGHAKAKAELARLPR